MIRDYLNLDDLLAIRERMIGIGSIGGKALGMLLARAILRRDVPATVPPLLKGYLRAGALICGAPAWDPDFNTADLPLLLPTANISARYARHFVKRNT